MLRPRLLAAFTVATAVTVFASVQAAPLTAPGRSSTVQSHVAKPAASVKGALVKATRTVQEGAHDLAVYALGLIGVSYRFGGETPDDGLDCSGLVRHVFEQVSGITLPRTAREMSRVGGSVARAELAPGDLVFFNTRRFAFSHVGIYVGDDRFIHAPRTGRDVEVASLDNAYWRQRFDGARRLTGTSAAPEPKTLARAEPAAIELVDAGQQYPR